MQERVLGELFQSWYKKWWN